MFIEVVACSKSLRQRKLVYGVGVNDAWYRVSTMVDNHKLVCPHYSRWVSLLQRCYSKDCIKKHPAYSGASVCESWLVFSKFKTWIVSHDWEGKDLDKDILMLGNKHYSPSTCVLVLPYINRLLINQNNPHQGVKANSCGTGYSARLHKRGKAVQIGTFSTESEAFKDYLVAKFNHITEVVNSELTLTEQVRSGLLNHANSYLSKSKLIG